MPTPAKRSINPQLPIAVGLGASGAAKLAGVQFTRDNFKRWGYADWWRPAIGAIEVATAATALVGLRHDGARTLAAASTLATMGGAIATHLTAGEPAYNAVPAVALAGFGVVALFRA